MSPNPLRRLLVALAVVTAACGGSVDDGAVSGTVGPGADTPEGAVRMLVADLNAPDFQSASDLAVPGHAALAALTEGAAFADVAEALRTGDAAIASNFWSGFAQGAGSLLLGAVVLSGEPVVTQDEIEFHPVVVEADSGEMGTMMSRDVNGYRVDLFASFGAGLADKMIPPVERLLVAQTDHSRLILKELQDIVPSLLIAARQDDLPPAISQDILRLVELITRVS